MFINSRYRLESPEYWASVRAIMSNVLEKELKYYQDNLEQLVQEYGGKFIVIKNAQVIGAYDDELEAVQKTATEHEMGTFFVQKCGIDKQNDVQQFHSRAAFG